MFSFLVISLAIPEAFTGSGIAFGLGYLLVTTVHTALFWTNGGTAAATAVLRLAPMNALSAGLVLTGGFLNDGPRYLCWTLAMIVQFMTPQLTNPGGFVIRAGHFCERHGLVVIVALGESVVAIGLGLAGEEITTAMVALGLALVYTMWWAYFGADDECGQQALAALPGPRRGRTAALAYGYAMYPMLIGVILTAAGLHTALAESNHAIPTAAALALSGGIALYLLGQCCFRWALGLPRPWLRLTGAITALATAPIGITWTAWAQLAVLLIVTNAFVITADTFGRRRARSLLSR